MGAYWRIKIGRSKAPIWGNSYVPDKLMLIFTEQDMFLDEAKLKAFTQPELDADDSVLFGDEDKQLMGYAARAGVLRSRLDVQGFSSDWIKGLATAFFDDELEDENFFMTWPEGSDRYPCGSMITAALVSRRGQNAGIASRPELRHNPEKRFLHAQWRALSESFDDPRFALALALSQTRSSTMVTLDLSSLVLGGYLEPCQKPHVEARSRMSAEVAASGPVIMITEGASDARWLRRSLEISAPEVADYFKFLEFDQFKTPGGVDRVASLTKGMAAAGVMNRVIAVLDNDTAGNIAAHELRLLQLPTRIKVVTLPTVEYAEKYPTIGPAGKVSSDINGTAVSIEFMFGEDVLRHPDGALPPIRWHSFIEKANAYQGRLDNKDKSALAKRIDNALFSSESVDAHEIAPPVRAGCDRLSQLLISSADQIKNVSASESSDLSASWRDDPFARIEIE
jgi:hypothetical protein